MKTAGTCFKKQGLLRAVILFCLAVAAAASGQVAGNTAYCEITLTGCPHEYDGDSLVVPLNVIALSTRVRACGIQDSTKDLGAAPAIMFLIDHSQSMISGQAGGTGNDGNGNRFRVTRALIDTIYKVYPDAQVGVAVFAEGLVFNNTWDQNLVLFDGVTDTTWNTNRRNQSYLPLMPLDSSAKGGGFASGGNPTWLDVVRGMFDVPAAQTARSRLRNGSGGTVAEISGTNISIAFEAAKQAFERQKVSTPKQNQYIIFLSDGDPGIYNGGTGSIACDGNVNSANPRCAMQDDFIAGTNTPTTFTVFLTSAADPRPGEKVRQMTLNIRGNAYSESNLLSGIWAMSSDYNSLLTHMLEHIVSQMLSKSSGTAKTIVISSPNVKDSTGTITDGDFTFSRRLPVDTTVVTPVAMTLRYDVRVDSTTAAGTDTSYIIPNKPFSYNFTVRRTADTSTNWESSQNLSKSCNRAPTLDLQYNGESLVNKEVKGNMSPLTIVFDNKDGLFNYESVVVSVLNADSSVSDLENFTLNKGSDGKWTFQFPRVVAPSANHGDRTLQHTERNDSIILVFRNPNVPLDTIRLSVPYISNTMVFYDAPGNPAGGKKLSDVIEVKVGERLAIYAKLFFNGAWDPDMIKVPGSVMEWTINDTLSAILNPDPDKNDKELCTFFTNSAGGTYTITATYRDSLNIATNGVEGVKITKQITVKVSPGEPLNTAGPNPFAPGSSVMDYLNRLGIDSKTIYKPIVEGSMSGGGNGNAENARGVLIAATAPRPMSPNGGNGAYTYAKAAAVIYDAVGHIVFKSKPEDIVMAEDRNTFGFVWSGKNLAGRTVGPGTYLMRMNATMENGEKFSYQRMIGVTTHK